MTSFTEAFEEPQRYAWDLHWAVEACESARDVAVTLEQDNAQLDRRNGKLWREASQLRQSYLAAASEIASLSAEVGRLREQRDAALKVHRVEWNLRYCLGCGKLWPCPTAAALGVAK